MLRVIGDHGDGIVRRRPAGLRVRGMAWCFPSEKVPVAASCWEVPGASTAPVGPMVSDCSTAPVTVIVA